MHANLLFDLSLGVKEQESGSTHKNADTICFLSAVRGKSLEHGTGYADIERKRVEAHKTLDEDKPGLQQQKDNLQSDREAPCEYLALELRAGVFSPVDQSAPRDRQGEFDRDESTPYVRIGELTRPNGHHCIEMTTANSSDDPCKHHPRDILGRSL